MERLDIFAHLAADCADWLLTDQTAMCINEFPVTCTATGCVGATFGGAAMEPLRL